MGRTARQLERTERCALLQEPAPNVTPAAATAPKVTPAIAGDSSDRDETHGARAWFAGRRSKATRRAYASDLAQLGRWLAGDVGLREPEAHAVAARAGPEQLPAWRDAMIAAELQPATIARRISAARSFFRFLRAAGYRSDDPGAGLEVPRVARELQRRPFCEASDVRSLLRAATTGRHAPNARRNRPAIRLLASLGLRCGELCELRRDDFDQVAKTVRVRGKGGRVRILDTGERLAGELLELGEQLEPGDRFFPISTRRVRQLLATWRRIANVPDATPHALRRTFVTVAFDRGTPLEEVRRTLGHNDPRTTAGYDRRRHASVIVEYD